MVKVRVLKMTRLNGKFANVGTEHELDTNKYNPRRMAALGIVEVLEQEKSEPVKVQKKDKVADKAAVIPDKVDDENEEFFEENDADADASDKVNKNNKK